MAFVLGVSDYTLEELCVEVKKIWYQGIDLIGPDNWEIL